MSQPQTAPDETAPYDAIIVGGGISGLTAAWHLRDRRILLLESSDRLGGRLRSEPVGDYWLNYGAHLFPAPGSVVDTMLTDVGLQTVPVSGSMMGMALGSTVLTTGGIESYPLRLPLPLRERIAFARAGLRLKRAVSKYFKVAAIRPGESAADARGRVISYLDDVTFGDFMGGLPPMTASIFACAAHRATAEPDELTAGSGVGLFALVWGGKDSLIARNLVGGPAVLPQTVGNALGEIVQLGATVTEVRPVGAHCHEVAYTQGGRTVTATARHVVVATPAPVAATLVDPIAPAAGKALSQLTYGPFLSVAVLTNEQHAMPWDDVYVMATPGRCFDIFNNQAGALRTSAKRTAGGSLMLYAGGQNAGRLAQRSDDEISAAFLDDLYTLYPQARGLVVETRVHRWEWGNVFATPGRSALQSSLEGALGDAGTVHLAGDYFAELGSMEAAAKTGKDAATRVKEALGVDLAPTAESGEPR